MVSCPGLGKARLDDINPPRDGTDSAEITNLSQAVLGADLKACRPTGSTRFVKRFDNVVQDVPSKMSD